MRLRALAIATMVLPTGCSFLFVERPTRGMAEAAPDCTRSRIAPAIDAAVGAGSVVFAVAVASEKNCEPGLCDAKGAVVTASLVAAAVAGVSSVWGFVQTSRCGSRIDAWCADHGGCAARTESVAPAAQAWVADRMAAQLRRSYAGKAQPLAKQ